jgi:RNA polymerase sigma-70 factor (sigma-E family)
MEPGSAPSRDDRVAALWASHHVELTRLALGMTGDLAEAEVLVQDAFAALLARWSQLRDHDAALSYLRRVVVNGGRGRWRRLRRDREVVNRVAVAAPAHRLVMAHRADNDVDERLDLLGALSQLPAGRRACVVLRHYADLSEAEVAGLLGISVGTVKSQTARALQQLAKAIDQSSTR